MFFVGEGYLEPFDAARHWSQPAPDETLVTVAAS
jgi:hypothetical protein